MFGYNNRDIYSVNNEQEIRCIFPKSYRCSYFCTFINLHLYVYLLMYLDTIFCLLFGYLYL